MATIFKFPNITSESLTKIPKNNTLKSFLS